MSLINFPSELLFHISQYLDHADLKRLHLTNKRWAKVVTEVLFETIHLTPNLLSYNRALQIVSSETHRQYVKTITYHTGILYSDFEGFDDFKKQVRLGKQPSHTQDPQEWSEKMLWHYSCWLEETDAQTAFACKDELRELTNICSRLPNLEHINTIMDGYRDVTAEPTDYIGRRTGMQSGLESQGSHFSNLFLATHERPLMSISALSRSWEIFTYLDERTDIAKSKCFKTLRSLELGLFNAEFIEINSTNEEMAEAILRAYSKFLRAARHIERLSLDFDELPFEASALATDAAYSVAFDVPWSRLRSLELKGLAVNETKLGDFLLAQRRTLHSLHLGDIELTGNLRSSESEVEEKTYGSVVTLFDTLSRGLELKQAQISGNFINRVDEVWYVNPDSGESKGHSIVERLQDYLCRRAPSPFPRTFLEQRLRTKSRQAFHHDGPCLEAFVDGSWQWCPEMITQ